MKFKNKFRIVTELRVNPKGLNAAYFSNCTCHSLHSIWLYHSFVFLFLSRTLLFRKKWSAGWLSCQTCLTSLFLHAILCLLLESLQATVIVFLYNVYIGNNPIWVAAMAILYHVSERWSTSHPSKRSHNSQLHCLLLELDLLLSQVSRR